MLIRYIRCCLSLNWYSVAFDCSDVVAQSRCGATVLGWQVTDESADEVVVAPSHRTDLPIAQRGPGLVFVPVPEGKATKNRIHFDLAPPASGDQTEEVRRLEAPGATRVDVGQVPANVTWVVMANPEETSSAC